jgi:peptide/nickel transport system permease protein
VADSASVLQAQPTRLEGRRSLRWGSTGRWLRAHPAAMAGGCLIALGVLLATLGPVLVPYSPIAQDLQNPLGKPSPAHLLGTDQLGRDVLSRLVHGASTSLMVGVGAVMLGAIPGVAIGLIVGYRGGPADQIVMRILDGVMAFPSLVLALTIVSVLGPNLLNVMVAIAATSFPVYARLVRGQVLSVRELEYVNAIRVIGANDARILFYHVLPNVLGPIIVQAAFGAGFAIISEASLSFLGMGVQPPTPTWGSMIQIGFQYLQTAPWLVIAPATMIFVAVLGFQLFGDGLRDVLGHT